MSCINRKGFYRWICWYNFYQVTYLEMLDASLETAQLKPGTYIATVVIDGSER